MKRAVLLVNLGSPLSPTVPNVRKYLREFLMDGRVIDVPYPVRFFLVNFAIIPKRVKESTAAYKTIWTSEGSPLVVISQRAKELLQERLNVPVELAMRYQEPSIPGAISYLHKQGVTDILLIPLFPQYAMSSFETAVERVREVMKQTAPEMRVEVMEPYYNHPAFINALYESAADYLSKPYDHLLFSYHGLPERHMTKADPTGSHCMKSPNCCETRSPAHKTCYRAQCFATTRAFVAKAGIPAARYSVSFQSRLGKEPWLKPYTDEELARLPKAGVKKLLVICPAFVADCLETIEEIGERGRETFLHAGGEDFTFIPCMNEHPRWIDALQKFVGEKWPEAVAAPVAQKA